MMRMLIVCFLSLTLLACATPSSREISELQQGKRLFNDGYYKRAMHELLPIACDGNPDAQYGVGYMYYYGLGVVQDTEVGSFWIQRSAKQRYVPAIKALEMMDREDHSKQSV
jgi:TPR repeat protein